MKQTLKQQPDGSWLYKRTCTACDCEGTRVTITTWAPLWSLIWEVEAIWGPKNGQKD